MLVRIGWCWLIRSVRLAGRVRLQTQGQYINPSCDASGRLETTVVGAGGSPAPVSGTVSVSPAPQIGINSSGLAYPTLCDTRAQISVSSATTVALVAAVAGKAAHVCGFYAQITAGTSPTFSFSQGTQTTNPCDTGSSTLWSSIAGTGTYSFGGGLGDIFRVTTLGDQLCITVGGSSTPTVIGQLWYASLGY